MALRQPKPPKDNLTKPVVYQSSKGGWYPKPDKPVPGAKKEKK